MISCLCINENEHFEFGNPEESWMDQCGKHKSTQTTTLTFNMDSYDGWNDPERFEIEGRWVFLNKKNVLIATYQRRKKRTPTLFWHRFHHIYCRLKTSFYLLRHVYSSLLTWPAGRSWASRPGGGTVEVGCHPWSQKDCFWCFLGSAFCRLCTMEIGIVFRNDA